MSIRIHESVAVAAVFSKGLIRPRYFLWNGRKIAVDSVSFMWRTMVGANHIIHFSVVSGQTLYELMFDTRTLAWKLERLEAEIP